MKVPFGVAAAISSNFEAITWHWPAREKAMCDEESGVCVCMRERERERGREGELCVTEVYRRYLLHQVAVNLTTTSAFPLTTASKSAFVSTTHTLCLSSHTVVISPDDLWSVQKSLAREDIC